METVVGTIGQAGSFGLETERFYPVNPCRHHSSNFGFKFYSRPAFRFGVDARIGKLAWSLGLRQPICEIVCAVPQKETDNSMVNGGFLEKEFKFEPTFDEYLKVMESVRIGRGRNVSRDANSREEDDTGGRDCGAYRAENVSSAERIAGESKARICGSGGKIGERGEMIKIKNLKANGHYEVLAGGISSSRESDENLNGDRILRLYRKKYGDSRDVNGGSGERRKEENDKKYSRTRKELKQEGKLINVVIDRSVMKKSESHSRKRMEDLRGKDDYGNISVVERSKSHGNSRKVDSNSHDLVPEVQKKQPLQNKRWERRMVGNVASKGESDRRGLPKIERIHRSNFASEVGESEIGKDIYKRENYHKVINQRKATMSETHTSTFESDSSFRSHADEKMENVHQLNRLDEKKWENNSRYEKEIACEFESEGEKSSRYVDVGKDFRDQYKRRTYAGSSSSSAEVGKPSSRGSQISKRWNRSSANESDDCGCKSTNEDAKVRRRNEVFMGSEDENDLEMDRKAFRTFEEFTDVRGRPRVLRMEMEGRIQKLAKWLNGTDVDMPAWKFSKMMHSAQIRFTDHSILRVIQILGAFGNWKRVLQVVQWLQARERFKSYKSKFIYTTVLSVLRKLKRPVEALNVFYAMRQEFSSYPDLAAYHCIAVTLGQVGLLKELFDVIDCMRAFPQKKFKTGMLEKWDPRLEPDEVVYNAVLNACVHQKQWEGAFWVLQQFKQQYKRPSSTTYGLVMEVMFACGKYNLVHELFRKVEKSTIPNTLNYKVLLNTLWKEGKTDEALLAVQDMERRGIVGSASLYYDLARCLCSAGRCQEALQQINKICKVAKKPIVVTYTGLIQACLESGSVQDGAFIFYEMRKFCSPNIVTCNIMLKAYVENKMFAEAKDLFQNIVDSTDLIRSAKDYKDRLIPDKYTFNTMLEACVREKRWDEFEKIYQRMLHHGYLFNPKHHLHMILEASRAGKVKSIDSTWHHLVRSGQNMPVALIKERFCLKLQEGDIATALSCIESGQRKGLHTFSEREWLDFMNRNIHRFQKGTLAKLVDEVNTLNSHRDQPDPAYQNLLYSSRELYRAPGTEAATSYSVNGGTSEVEVNLS